MSGVRDRVHLNADRYAVKVAEIERRLQSVVASTGVDWRCFMRSTLGGELSFHEPLKMGLGRAARSGKSDEASGIDRRSQPRPGLKENGRPEPPSSSHGRKMPNQVSPGGGSLRSSLAISESAKGAGLRR